MEAAIEAGISLTGTCGGKGTCGKCQVMTDKGPVFACRYQVTEDMVVETETEEEIRTMGKEVVVLPENFFVEKGGSETYGIAVDLGTTSVAVLLWDLEEGRLLDSMSFQNPQCTYGADVMSRITFAMESDAHRKILQRAAHLSIKENIEKLAKKNGIDLGQIIKTVVVGNTAMSQLFAGEDVKNLAVAPFHARLMEGLELQGDISTYVGPNIAGHVGSDVAAGITAVGIDRINLNTLYIDIGTNGEIVLASKGTVYCCSTAAGPAFEGQSVSRGMRSVPGAICHVNLTDQVELSVIGGQKPKGICGSGVIAAVAALTAGGIIDGTGRILNRDEIQNPVFAKHIISQGEVNGFALSFDQEGEPDVVLTQKDVREVQLAKAAVYGGIEILLDKAMITAEKLDRIMIAGAFGNSIDPKCAMEIGLIPQIPAEKIDFIGNAAATGASMMLLSDEFRKQAAALAARVEHVELAASADFQIRYINAMGF